MATTGDIVVGYDASPEAELAIDWAVGRAKLTGSKLHVLNVLQVEPAPGLSGLGYIPADYSPDDLDIAKLAGVQRAIDELGKDDVVVSWSPGNPAWQLVEASGDASLIVVGSRGRGALAAGLLGSTAYAVAAHSECPVVVVRGHHNGEHAPAPGPNHPIVVGVEDADTSRELLVAAGDLAAESGALLRIVRASQLPTFGDWAAAFRPSRGDVDNAIVEHDTDILNACVELIRRNHADLKIEAIHETGDPSAVLVSKAKSASMIVVGSRGRGGFRGLLLGSVSHAVIQLAECPVYVIRSASPAKTSTPAPR